MADQVLVAPAPRDPSQKYWDPAAQTLDPERRRGIQDQRVRELIRRVFDAPALFFARKLAAAGIKHAEDVRGLDDLARIPLTVKQELRDAEAAHPPIGDHRFTALKECVRIGQSTGTTGTPSTVIWTRKDLFIELESAARGFWRRGHRPGMVATHAHPAYLYGGGAIVSTAYEYFGLVNLWVPPPETDALAELGIRAWMRFKPDLPFRGFSMGRYLEVCQKLGLDPVKDVGLNLKSSGSSHGDRPPLLTAGIDCYTFLGDVCSEASAVGGGAHLNEEWAVVQSVDPETGRDVPDGEWGNLVVTTLDRDNGLLRFDLEEACAIDRRRCPCGDTTVRGFWGGRFKDLLSAQGKRFQVSQVEQALRTIEAVCKPSLEWVVVRPKDPMSALQVRVELADGDRNAVAAACTGAIKTKLGLDATVEIVARETLPRSGYKATRVVDR